MFCYTGKPIKEKIISDSNKQHEEIKMGGCDEEWPGGRRAGLDCDPGRDLSLRRWHFELWPARKGASFAKLCVCVWRGGITHFRQWRQQEQKPRWGHCVVFKENHRGGIEISRWWETMERGEGLHHQGLGHRKRLVFYSNCKGKLLEGSEQGVTWSDLY